ncbi:MAG: flagellar hook basal-body protein [Bryobacterales bacterium]|nr:flagellar hook basal-body protein [Bryobacterales bacterium]
MDPITSLLAGGMTSRLDSLDLLANNIANASSAGYKADRERFSAFLSADLAEALATGETRKASEIPMVEDRFTEFRQGTFLETDVATDVALDGEGFFSVETPRGVRYTRAGRFHLERDGELRTREGYRVRVKQTRDPKRLAADPAQPIRVTPRGEIFQGENRLGVMDRVGFGRPDLLRKEEAVYFRAVEGMTELARETPVVSGSLEASNVDAAAGSFRLVETTRQFGMLNRAFTLHDGLQRGLIERVAKW